MQQLIEKHNKIVNDDNDNTSSRLDILNPLCSCRDEYKCPLEGKCTINNIIYQYRGKTNKIYIADTERL